jgi:hypothetical protein
MIFIIKGKNDVFLRISASISHYNIKIIKLIFKSAALQREYDKIYRFYAKKFKIQIIKIQK